MSECQILKRTQHEKLTDKEKPTKLTVVFDTLIYNDVATATPKVTLEFEWELNKTTVIVLKKNVPIQMLTFVGLRVVRLTTLDGVIGYAL